MAVWLAGWLDLFTLKEKFSISLGSKSAARCPVRVKKAGKVIKMNCHEGSGFVHKSAYRVLYCKEGGRGSPLVLRHCSWGSGASGERLGSADSAVAVDGGGTGGGASRHPHSDPWERQPTEELPSSPCLTVDRSTF